MPSASGARTLADVKRDRARQVARIQKELRDLDTSVQKMQRKLNVYKGKRKLLEAFDVPPLVDLWKGINNTMNDVERELTALATLVR